MFRVLFESRLDIFTGTIYEFARIITYRRGKIKLIAQIIWKNIVRLTTVMEDSIN
jgi:hypothetical protein